MEAKRRHRGDIAIVWQKEGVWEVEGARIFGTNVVSFTVMLGQKHWFVVQVYVTPNNQPAVHWVAQALTCRPVGVGKRIVGDLNT